MGVTGIGIGVGIGPFDLSKPSGSALDVITSSNGAWWVVKERGKNKIVQSDFATGGSGWATQNASISGGRLTENSSAGLHRIYDTDIPFSASDYGTFSVRVSGASAGRGVKVIINNNGAFGFNVFAVFNPATQTFPSVGGAVTDYGYTDEGGGVYRVWVQGQMAASPSTLPFCAVNMYDIGGATDNYTGDGSSYVDISDAQFEVTTAAAPEPTSFEATSGTATYNALLDQTGGGRHLLLPGGSANPVLLDHTGTSYIWFPGTASNTLTTGGLSNSTAYDYKVWYLDGSTATGEETTDGSGVLTLGGTQTNFNVKKVTRIRVVADGADPDVATAVRDILASDADPNSTTFTEASSNAATVTINRSSTGYCTEVVDQPGYAFATDDYLYATDDALFDVGASDEFTAGLVVRVHGTPGSDYALITKKNTTSGTDAGWSLQENTAGKLDARVADGTASPDKVTASAVTDHVLIAASIVRDATTVGAYDPTAGSIETASDTTTGTLANAQQLRIGADGGGADFLRGFVVGGFFLKDTARTAAQIDGLSAALITANGGTP